MTHLLLVDDEVNLLAALKRVLNRGLQRHDLTIDTFSDPQAALIRAAACPTTSWCLTTACQRWTASAFSSIFARFSRTCPASSCRRPPISRP